MPSVPARPQYANEVNRSSLDILGASIIHGLEPVHCYFSNGGGSGLLGSNREREYIIIRRRSRYGKGLVGTTVREGKIGRI
jgi:hypothetical protein